jgi:hypothetical protein
MQPFADRAFMDFDREPALDLLQQIDAPPAHDFVGCKVRKRCGGDGAGFELTIGAAADPAATRLDW